MPQVDNLVNKFGKMAGWNSAKLNIFGRDAEGITEISYDDNVEVEAIAGAGKMPIGYGEGNYVANFSLTLHMEEVKEILKSIPPGKRISDAAAVDVPIQYDYGTELVTDIIRNVKITGLGKEVKQGDKVVGQKVEVFCTHIDWHV